MKKLLKDKNYSHLDTLLDDIIKLWQTLHGLGMHDFELPDSIPKNIVQLERPPKQQVLDAHITRFTKQTTPTEELKIFIFKLCVNIIYCNTVTILLQKFSSDKGTHADITIPHSYCCRSSYL